MLRTFVVAVFALTLTGCASTTAGGGVSTGTAGAVEPRKWGAEPDVYTFTLHSKGEESLFLKPDSKQLLDDALQPFYRKHGYVDFDLLKVDSDWSVGKGTTDTFYVRFSKTKLAPESSQADWDSAR